MTLPRKSEHSHPWNSTLMQWQASCVMIVHEPHVHAQVAVVQFSNDVRVEVAPQNMPLDELKRQLDEMVRILSDTHVTRSHDARSRNGVFLVVQHLKCLACLCQSRMNGGTNIALAIKQAGQLLKNEDADASRIIVLLTDGRVDTFQGELQTSATWRFMGFSCVQVFQFHSCHSLSVCRRSCMQGHVRFSLGTCSHVLNCTGVMWCRHWPSKSVISSAAG